MSRVKLILVVFFSVLLWVAVALYGGLSGWWLTPLAPAGDTDRFYKQAVRIADEHNRGNLALRLIRGGQIFGQHVAGRDVSINENTLFPTASLSKWFTAAVILQLAEQGRLDIDAPISRYLTRWRLPASEFDGEKVTVRHLLSHTAGLNDGLGFGEYGADEQLPTLLETLNNPRASSGEPVEIKLGAPAGQQWQYSGGGYLILELIVEEVSGLGFADVVSNEIFTPLGMQRSTYEFPGQFDNRAHSYDIEGNPVPLYRYAAKGATGLSSSIADLSLYVRTVLAGGASHDSLIARAAERMQQPQGYKWGAAIWGLGAMLYAPTPNGRYVYGHDGANEPAINSAVRINPDNGDAIIVLDNGSGNLASLLAYHWTLWQTGYPDFLSLDRAVASAMTPIIVGSLVILLLALGYWVWRRAGN